MAAYMLVVTFPGTNRKSHRIRGQLHLSLCPVHAAFNTTTTGLEVPTLEHLQHKSKRKAKAKKLSFKLLSSLLIAISIAKNPFLLQKYYFFTFLKKSQKHGESTLLVGQRFFLLQLALASLFKNRTRRLQK